MDTFLLHEWELHVHCGGKCRNNFFSILPWMKQHREQFQFYKIVQFILQLIVTSLHLKTFLPINNRKHLYADYSLRIMSKTFGTFNCKISRILT